MLARMSAWVLFKYPVRLPPCAGSLPQGNLQLGWFGSPGPRHRAVQLVFSALADSLLMYLLPCLGTVFGIIHILILHSHRAVAIICNDSPTESWLSNSQPRYLSSYFVSSRFAKSIAVITGSQSLDPILSQYPNITAAQVTPYSSPKNPDTPYAPNAPSTTPQNYPLPPHQPSKPSHPV